MFRFLRYLLITVTSIIMVIVLLPWILRGFGFYVDNPGWEVGIMAAEKKDPRICQKIIVYSSIFGPTTVERRGECIFRYAEITQDPFACEQLMPSKYGLACISHLWLNALPDDGCGWNPNDSNIFQCRHTGGPLRQSKNCVSFIDIPKQYSACLESRAERAKDARICSDIPDSIIRSICIVRMNAWQKYPELLKSF